MVARLKAQERPATLIARAGVEAHEAEIVEHARTCNLRVRVVHLESPDLESCIAALRQAEDVEFLILRNALGPGGLRALYEGCDVVLANSGREPFGLVGLEAMAAGGTVFTGETGEEYARHLENAIVLGTDDPAEAAWYTSYLDQRPLEEAALRRRARETAQAYSWDRVVAQLLARVGFLLGAQRAPTWSQGWHGEPLGTRKVFEKSDEAS